MEGIGTSDFMYPAAFETEWSKSQDKGTLTRYISHALQILKNVGLEASGVTSPGDFGRGNEDNYARAVLGAQKLVNHISIVAGISILSLWRPETYKKLARRGLIRKMAKKEGTKWIHRNIEEVSLSV